MLPTRMDAFRVAAQQYLDSVEDLREAGKALESARARVWDARAKRESAEKALNEAARALALSGEF